MLVHCMRPKPPHDDRHLKQAVRCAAVLLAMMAIAACTSDRSFYRIAEDGEESDFLIPTMEQDDRLVPDDVMALLRQPGIRRVVTIAGAAIVLADDRPPLLVMPAHDPVAYPSAEHPMPLFDVDFALENLPEALSAAPRAIAKPIAAAILRNPHIAFGVYTETSHRAGEVLLTASGHSKLAKIARQ